MITATSKSEAPTALFDVYAARQDFPILKRTVHGKPLVYLDNGVTSQKPLSVIEATDNYYREQNANVHRGVYELSQKATAAFDRSRALLAQFLNAGSPDEVIFTKGCTEAINLVAQSWGGEFLSPGDEILLSQLEHHSNIVPWQLIAKRTGAIIRVIPMDDRGMLDQDSYLKQLQSGRVKMVGVNHVSNALGTVNPVNEMAALAHAHGALILVDGAQSCPHMAVDVQGLNADFYTVSGHKIYGPTGFGALYAKAELLEQMPPYQGGGDMIRTVSFEGSTFAEAPAKFEAGSPNIAGAIGLAAAINYLAGFGEGNTIREKLESAMPRIAAHEAQLLQAATKQLLDIPGAKVIGTAPHKEAILSFTLEGIHPHDIGTILDSEGIAVRAGHHCCMPLMTRLGLPATTRASFGLYNTLEEVEIFSAGVRKTVELFQ